MLQTLKRWVFQIHSQNLAGNFRFMTTTEVSTALRPFYFTVHPDLFGQYPSQRTTNENSLKHLSSVIETLHRKKSIQPCQLQFYVRDKSQVKGHFRLVKIYLKDPSLRETVITILKSCQLSTEYVDNIPKCTETIHTRTTFRPQETNMDFSNIDEYDPLYARVKIKRRIKETLDSFTLRRWLSRNYKTAVERHEKYIPLHEEIGRLKRELQAEFGLKEIRFDCGWNETHFRGCLQSFKALADQHPYFMHVLRGRVLVFAPFTGVSLDGHIMLNSGEVRNNWLELIKNIRKYDASLDRIPAFERAVSQVLRDIKVVRRKFMPKVLAGEYERHLQQITTALSDYKGRREYPKVWPESFKDYEIVVETEAGPLMVSPTGQFIVPSSCPGSLLVSFITDNLSESAYRSSVYNQHKHVEKSLHKACIDVLQLLDLRKDDSVTPELMIKCCERLLQYRDELQNLKGTHLNITTYYSVLSDGVVCIPWNWKI